MAAVSFTKVSKVYPDGTRAVSDLTLDTEDGEFVVLVGPSGCGKTTALRMVAGLEEITDGEIHIADRLVNWVPARERDIAMVFQSYALYPHLSVRDNIAFGLKLRKLDKAEVERRVENAARVLGLDQLLDRKPRALSGGQRQRVAMGRAIVAIAVEAGKDVEGVGSGHVDSDAGLAEEVGHLLGAALRLVFEEEMANAFEQHELGAGNLACEAGRVLDREVLVTLAPEDERRHAECREPSLVGLELVEIEGAIELEHAATAVGGGECLPVLVERALVELGGGLLQQRAESFPGETVHERLTLASGFASSSRSRSTRCRERTPCW